MKGKHWLSVVILSAAASAALPGSAAWGQPIDGTGGAGAGDSASAVNQRELQQLRDTLFDRDKTTRERDEAARRLRDREAYNILQDALRSNRADCQASVARALAIENPPPQFLDDLMRCLQPQTGADAAEAVSAALVNYRDYPAARARLREFVQNANAGEAARVRAVRALGSLSDKETAQFLVQVTQGDDPRITPPISDAAADALTELTGQESIGRDAGLWAQWWQQEAPKSPAQFLADRRAEREGSARQLAARVREMTNAITKDVTDTHLKIGDPDAREANILARLKNPLPEYRAAGAQLVNVEQINGRTVGQPVKDRLHELIADSSPDVRRSVAGAFAAINDPTAAPLLLAQLRRERIPANRVALIAALAPTKDVAAVHDLLRALEDPSFQVVEAAARALTEVGPEVAKNPVLSGEVARALLTALDRTRKHGATRLRERIVEAMVPLKNPDLVNPLVLLLSDADTTSPALRVAAAKALGQMTVSKQTQDKIAQALAQAVDPRREREKTVRLEAALALGAVGGPGQAGILLNSMNPAYESDPDTRDAAWKSLTNLFDQLDPIVLQGYANNFRNEPARQLPVYLALNKKYMAQNLPNDVAATQEEIANLYMNPQIDKPDKAVPYFAAALTHWDAIPGATKEGIQTGLLEAYLRSKQVKDGIEFARVRIQRNKTAQDSLGRAILREVDRLEQAKDLKGAAELLAEAKTLPIEGTIRMSIDDKDKDIRAKILPFNDRLAEDWRGIFA